MQQPIKYDEGQLVEMLRERSNAGFAYLYENYGSALFGAINDIVPDPNIAADILQDVFVNIFRKIGSYDSTRFRLYTWMLAIARNLSIDHVRSKDHRKRQLTSDVSQAIELRAYGAAIEVDHIGVRAMCMKLPPKHRNVVELNYFHGYTHEQISELLGLPLGTVKTTVRAALLRLREMMEPKKTATPQK